MRTNFRKSIIIQPTLFVNDPDKVMQRHHVAIEDIIDLCGGIPVEFLSFYKITITPVHPVSIDVIIENDIYKTERRINFETMIIRNDLMQVYKQGQQIGTSLLWNQVCTSRQIGFKEIKLIAQGPDVGRNWNGHYSWGRMGFIMNYDDLIDFRQWLSAHQRSEATFQELLSTENGRSIWQQFGFSWSGSFDLRSGSESLYILIQYLTEKGIIEKEDAA